MKILIDTNVLISALVFRGRPRTLLIRLLEEEQELFVSSYIDQEFRRKLRQKWPDRMERILEVYEEIAFPILESTHETRGELRDANDIPILSDAIYHDIDIILTGDKDFLDAGLVRPKAMSVSMLFDYLDR